MNEVSQLTDHGPEPLKRFGTEYAQSALPEVMRFFENCGLAPEYLAILGRHVSDLELVIEDPGNTGSTLMVGSRLEGDQKKWFRAALLSRADLSDKKTVLEEVLENMEIDKTASLNESVLNWGFYELVADGLANAVSMQKRFNKYIPDWNGQAYCYMSQYAISEMLFEEYGQSTGGATDEEHQNRLLAIRRDHRGFRSGVALELLRDNLLLNVTDKVTQANWIIRALCKGYYSAQGIVPLTKQEITSRLIMLQPKVPTNMIGEFIDRYFDEPEPDDA